MNGNTGLSPMREVFQLPDTDAIVGRFASVRSLRGLKGEAAFRLILLGIGFSLMLSAILGRTGRGNVAAASVQAPQSNQQQSLSAVKKPTRDIGEAGQSRQQQTRDRSDGVG